MASLVERENPTVAQRNARLAVDPYQVFFKQIYADPTLSKLYLQGSKEGSQINSQVNGGDYLYKNIIGDKLKGQRFRTPEEANAAVGAILSKVDPAQFGAMAKTGAQEWQKGWDESNKPASFFGMNPDTVNAAAGLAIGAGAASGLGGGSLLGAGSSSTASGLAGTLGMSPGAAATALNSGALNTGMSLLRGNNIGDSLKQGATAALMSPIASGVGNATGSLFGNSGLSPTLIKGISNVAGNAASGGAGSLLRGTDVMTGIRNGAVNGIVSSIGNQAGGLAKSATGGLGQPLSNAASYIANQGTQSLLRGKQPNAQQIATNALYNFGTNSLFKRA